MNLPIRRRPAASQNVSELLTELDGLDRLRNAYVEEKNLLLRAMAARIRNVPIQAISLSEPLWQLEREVAAAIAHQQAICEARLLAESVGAGRLLGINWLRPTLNDLRGLNVATSFFMSDTNSVLTGRSSQRPVSLGGIELFDHQHFANHSLNDGLLDLSLRLLKLRRQMEVAEAQASGVNVLVNAVWQMGLLPRTAYLGPIIHTRPYSPQIGGHDSGQVFQAALIVPGGVGASIWDTEEFAALADLPDGLEAAAFLRHVPFEECAPAIRALLKPHIPLLTSRFLRASDWLQQ